MLDNLAVAPPLLFLVACQPHDRRQLGSLSRPELINISYGLETLVLREYDILSARLQKFFDVE
jgi:hypothetical protein